MTRPHRRSSGGFPPAPHHYSPVEPNDLWTIDFKGWWRTLDGTRCDPLTVRDAVSRYLLALRAMSRTRTEDVRPVFEELFDRYGLPKAIRSDNGPPFASLRGPGGLTQLSAWWVSLDDWITTFNHVRPHEALGQRLPAEIYRVSDRRISRCVPFVHPDDRRVVQIDRQGWIRYDARRVYISYGLGGQKVGLEAAADGAVRVWFHRMLLGAFVPSRDTTIQPCDAGGETGTVDGGSVLADGALGVPAF